MPEAKRQREPGVLTVGARVVIDQGPLQRFEGEVLEIHLSRAVLSVRLRQQSAIVELDSDWIRPLGFPTRSAPEL